MKIDYKFIKRILATLENASCHEMRCQKLLEELEIKASNNFVDENLLDKFIGHIKILGDNNFLESSTKDYGFMRIVNGGYSLGNPTYRITAQGYAFFDVLKNDTAFNKIKDFAISNAMYIGREIIIRSAVSGITGKQ